MTKCEETSPPLFISVVVISPSEVVNSVAVIELDLFYSKLVLVDNNIQHDCPFIELKQVNLDRG